MEMPKFPDDNPKTAFGATKPGIHAVPPVALLHLGLAMADGKRKYGLTNWRENHVTAYIYYEAAFRHLASWWDGEQDAQDSGVHHLGHVMGCCAILLDAEAGGCLIDDRPRVPGKFSEMVKKLTRPLAVPTPDIAYEDIAGEEPEYLEHYMLGGGVEKVKLNAVTSLKECGDPDYFGNFPLLEKEHEVMILARRFCYGDDATEERRKYVLGWLDNRKLTRVNQLTRVAEQHAFLLHLEGFGSNAIGVVG